MWKLLSKQGAGQKKQPGQRPWGQEVSMAGTTSCGHRVQMCRTLKATNRSLKFSCDYDKIHKTALVS